MRKTSRSSKKLGAVPKVIFSGNKELCNEISRSGIKYGRFKTTSGKYTNFYVDIKGLFSMPTFLNAVTKEIVDVFKKHGLQVITVICVVCRSDSVNFDEFNKRNIELVPLVTISGTKK